MKQKIVEPAQPAKRFNNPQAVIAIGAAVVIVGGLFLLKHQNKVGLAGLSSKASEVQVQPHWPHSETPFNLTILNSTNNPIWKNHLTFSGSNWEQSDVVRYSHSTGKYSPEGCDFVPELINICNFNLPDAFFTSISAYSYFKDRIVTGLLIVNDAYLSSKNPMSTPQWRNRIICNGIGFVMGMPLREPPMTGDSTSCMEWGVDFYAVAAQTQPDTQDLDTMKSIYQQTEDVSSSAISSKVSEFNKSIKKNNFGKKIGSSADGRQDFYELDGGNGYKMRTAVLKK